jgi:hypothetical protein
MSKLQKKPSALKKGHPTLQKMNFYKFFLLLWVIFALLDPVPDPDSESGSTIDLFLHDPDLRIAFCQSNRLLILLERAERK